MGRAVWEPAASRTKPGGVNGELHTRALLHVGQEYSGEKNKQRKCTSFVLVRLVSSSQPALHLLVSPLPSALGPASPPPGSPPRHPWLVHLP